nr:hypothetical protein [Angustibacter aerolatus]
MAAARALLPRLARTDDDITAGRLRGAAAAVPVIGVGDVLQRPGDTAAISTEEGDVTARFVDVVPAFPGHSGGLPMLVVPADSFFGHLGEQDPRVAPPENSGRFNRSPTGYYPSLWTSQDAAALRRVTDARAVRLGAVQSIERVAQQPDLIAARRTTGLQVALGASIAAIAVLGLAMAADRGAERRRAADLMLARMGLHASGVRRGRVGEPGGAGAARPAARAARRGAGRPARRPAARPRHRGRTSLRAAAAARRPRRGRAGRRAGARGGGRRGQRRRGGPVGCGGAARWRLATPRPGAPGWCASTPR